MWLSQILQIASAGPRSIPGQKTEEGGFRRGVWGVGDPALVASASNSPLSSIWAMKPEGNLGMSLQCRRGGRGRRSGFESSVGRVAKLRWLDPFSLPASL